MSAADEVRRFVDADPDLLVGVYGRTRREVLDAQIQAALILDGYDRSRRVSVTVAVTVGDETRMFTRSGVASGPAGLAAADADVLRTKASGAAGVWLTARLTA